MLLVVHGGPVQHGEEWAAADFARQRKVSVIDTSGQRGAQGAHWFQADITLARFRPRLDARRFPKRWDDTVRRRLT